MQKTTKQIKQAVPEEQQAIESQVNAEVMEQAKATLQQVPQTADIQKEQYGFPRPTKDGAEASKLALSHVKEELPIDFDEVDDALADLLATTDFVTGNSKSSARQLNAVLAIVNHTKGKRSKVQKEVLQKLNIQVGDFVNVTVKNNQVILLKNVKAEGVQVKTNGYLYNTELVEAITKEFSFDFSNQSTHHLLNVTHKKWNNQIIAIITP